MVSTKEYAPGDWNTSWSRLMAIGMFWESPAWRIGGRPRLNCALMPIGDFVVPSVSDITVGPIGSRSPSWSSSRSSRTWFLFVAWYGTLTIAPTPMRGWENGKTGLISMFHPPPWMYSFPSAGPLISYTSGRHDRIRNHPTGCCWSVDGSRNASWSGSFRPGRWSPASPRRRSAVGEAGEVGAFPVGSAAVGGHARRRSDLIGAWSRQIGAWFRCLPLGDAATDQLASWIMSSKPPWWKPPWNSLGCLTE